MGAVRNIPAIAIRTILRRIRKKKQSVKRRIHHVGHMLSMECIVSVLLGLKFCREVVVIDTTGRELVRPGIFRLFVAVDGADVRFGVSVVVKSTFYSVKRHFVRTSCVFQMVFV